MTVFSDDNANATASHLKSAVPGEAERISRLGAELDSYSLMHSQYLEETMTGLEIAAATYLFAWAKRRGGKAAERVGVEVDDAVGLLMDRVHRVVADKLGDRSQGLDRLEREAQAGVEEPSATATALVTASLTAAIEDDPGFAAALRKAVVDLQAALSPGVGTGSDGVVSGNSFHGPTAVQSGNHNQQTNHFGA